MTVAEAVRDLRLHMQLTQPAFAREAVISATSIAHIETGQRMPDADGCIRLCRAALKAGREDLAEVLVQGVPGVREGLLLPKWRAVPTQRVTVRIQKMEQS